MLNANQERELAYLVTIDDIKPIPGRDRVECAVVGGWNVMVRKNEFQIGDPAIYFEIDSKCPEKEPFMFLAPKNFRIKTQKYKTPDGSFYSQGLLMSAKDFDWIKAPHPFVGIIDEDSKLHKVDDETRFLTQKLGITYYLAEDNKRKARTVDKYQAMIQRHAELFSRQPYRWLMKRKWGKRLLFLFYGKKKSSFWPEWVQKTDEERIQNMPWILEDKTRWIATEKIDGTSTTFTIKRKRFGRYKFYVCSRNVCFDKPGKKCFYDTNVYLEMAEKYDIERKMKKLLDDYEDCDWITIQGETYGEGIQSRNYKVPGHEFKAFNLITSKYGRYNTIRMKDLLEDGMGIPCVDIVNEEYVLPDTVEEVLNYATGHSVLDWGMREGIVFRYPDGTKSFKAVSNEYLEKYHN